MSNINVLLALSLRLFWGAVTHMFELQTLLADQGVTLKTDQVDEQLFIKEELGTLS